MDNTGPKHTIYKDVTVSSVVYRNVNPCRCTTLNNIVDIIISMTSLVKYDVNYVVQTGISTWLHKFVVLIMYVVYVYVVNVLYA